MERLLRIAAIIFVTCLISIPVASLSSAETGRNSLTFINQSGDYALVKLAGPSRKVVEIPDGKSKTVRIAGGTYNIYVRYGTIPGKYRYTKGEPFQIKEMAYSYTEASLTLHGVVNGNYRTEGSSESEFNRQ